MACHVQYVCVYALRRQLKREGESGKSMCFFMLKYMCCIVFLNKKIVHQACHSQKRVKTLGTRRFILVLKTLFMELKEIFYKVRIICIKKTIYWKVYWD